MSSIQQGLLIQARTI